MRRYLSGSTLSQEQFDAMRAEADRKRAIEESPSVVAATRLANAIRELASALQDVWVTRTTRAPAPRRVR